MEHIVDDEYVEFVDAFRSLKVLIDCCFGFNLDDGYKKYIQDFKEKWTIIRKFF